MRVLELGAGIFAQPERDSLDIRDLPNLKYHQSAVDLSNIEDDAYDELYTRDMIEHISWRDIPAALKEWLRVAPKVVIETPNGEELKMILNGETQVVPRDGNESDWRLFNRTCFGDQGYPEDCHKSYFTPEWLTELLYEAGAKEVVPHNSSTHSFTLEARR